MTAFRQKNEYRLQDLVDLVKVLRDPVDGCPWDKEQTHQSIRMNFIEETYEAVEAIDRQDADLLLEELGDVLLQVLLHAEIEHQDGGFDINGVADRICKKLILRHPHIFGTIQVKGTEQVLSNWEEIKRIEKEQKTGSDAIDDVPKALPALMRAQKINKRAAYVGFGYADVNGPMADLTAELQELKIALQTGSGAAEELGDLLFSATNVARHLHLDAEQCLSEASDKFSSRFRVVERLAREKSLDLHRASDLELDELWTQAKSELQNS